MKSRRQLDRIGCAMSAMLLLGSVRAQAQPVLIDSANVAIGPTDTTIIDQPSGTVVPLATAQITVRGRILTINGRHAIASLNVERSASNVAGVVTHDAAFSFDYSGGAGTDIVYGSYLIVSGNVTVQGVSGASVASRIDATGRGMGPGLGIAPGTPSNTGSIGGAGGGHGGRGGNASPFPGGGTYGSLFQPTDLGSGGGYYANPTNSGGAGGGAIRLTIGGTLTLDGAITANGMQGISAAGAGSGGSIWITCASFAGAGSISADGGTGGSGTWGGGGGGRIAAYYATTSFSGSIHAWGGAGTPRAGAGTVITRLGSTRGTLLIDNNAPTGAPGSSTEIPGASYDLDIIARNGAQFGPKEGDSPVISFSGDLTLGANSIAGPRAGEPGFWLSIAGNATIAATAGFDATGRGWPSAVGPGAGVGSNTLNVGGAGGGYGGRGVDAAPFPGGGTYGSLFQPTDLGSGGGYYADPTNPGGAGGGAIRLTIGGALTLDGAITANGMQGISAAGAGSGGSIWITCASFAGTGNISADGSAGGNWGPGGGGRIAAYYAATSFSGSIHAWGGSGNGRAGAGTVITRLGSTRGTLLIDNNASTGAVGRSTEIPGTSYDLDIIARNGAQFGPKEGDSPVISFSGDLTLGANSIAGPRAGEPGFWLSIAGNATIAATAAFDATGRGWPSALGPGAGVSSNTASIGGAGAGHGGRGVDASPFPGGGTYGSLFQPTDLGSGGGYYASPTNSGGAGGGAIRLTIGGALTLDGAITANGVQSAAPGGAGSGGSIWVTCASLAGTGSISADGGAGGGNYWGAGGGGRIAAYCAATSFSGSFHAWGGSGNGRAGAGTVIARLGSTRGTLLIDNNAPTGAVGNSTEIPGALYDLDIIARNGAQFGPKEGDSPVISFSGDLTLESNSIAGPRAGEPGFWLSIAGNATIAATAAINATGRGWPSALGPGAGVGSNTGSYGGAGGGYGGRGGNADPFSGGPTYGSVTTPVDMGSGGGYYGNTTYPGGAGGGAIRLTIGGTLTLNGAIIANGAQSATAGGAGSGGSIWLTAHTVAGSGFITAAGGTGGGGVWGPGGGGRIAVYSCNLPITVTISASAGSGSSPAQAGTVFLTGSSTITITQQPQPNVPVNKGLPVQIFVLASTTQPGGALTYQWRKRDNSGEYQPLTPGPHYSGINSSTLTVNGATCSDNGSFDVLISDTCGVFPSEPSHFSVYTLSDIVGIGGDPPGDGFVTGDDFNAFINAFAASDPLADLVSIGGLPPPDGLITGDDFNAFIADFASGCP